MIITKEIKKYLEVRVGVDMSSLLAYEEGKKPLVFGDEYFVQIKKHLQARLDKTDKELDSEICDLEMEIEEAEKFIDAIRAYKKSRKNTE